MSDSLGELRREERKVTKKVIPSLGPDWKPTNEYRKDIHGPHMARYYDPKTRVTVWHILTEEDYETEYRYVTEWMPE